MKKDFGNIFFAAIGIAIVTLGLLKPWDDHITETLFVTILLMGLIGVNKLFIPKIAKSLMILLGGALSEFIDSFVIMLAIKKAYPKDKVYQICMTLSALTVGVLLFIGELYALAYYIHYGMHKQLLSGYPMAILVLPPVVVLMIIVAIRDAKSDYEKTSIQNSDLHWHDNLQMVVMLIFLITTHNALLCIGIFITWEALIKDGFTNLLSKLWEEIHAGGWIALLLIIAMYPLQKIGFDKVIANADGPILVIYSAISAPLTGAFMTAGSLSEFYEHMGYLIVGAVMFPTSAFVGVLMFKPSDWGIYMKFSIPYAILLFLMHTVYVYFNVYEAIARNLGIVWIGN